jgi:hypothetical protein
LVDFQIERPAGEEARVTVDETKVNVGTLRRCKIGDGIYLEEESTVVDESDLSWVEQSNTLSITWKSPNRWRGVQWDFSKMIAVLVADR